MAWTILLVSAVLEAVWATALGYSEGLTQPVPTIVFLVACAASMVGLALAMKRIPLSVAYAVWIGIGAALTVAVSMITGEEPVSVLKVVFLGGIVACVIGLKFAGGTKPPDRSTEAPETR